MEDKKRRIQITLTEKEIATLEEYGVKSEVISGLINNHLETPANWVPEEEKREVAPYKMYYKKDTLYLAVTYEEVVEGWDHDYDGNRYWTAFGEKEVALLKYEEGEGFMYCSGRDEEAGNARYAFQYFYDEIMEFAKTLKPGQVVEDGKLIEKEGN